MKRKGLHIAALIAVLISSAACSVLEDRDDCPCYLDLTVMRQRADVYINGNAWCSMWDGSDMLDYSPLDYMNTRDTTLHYSVYPRRRVAVVTANRDVKDGKFTVPAGEEMAPVYAYRKEFDCSTEDVTGVIDTQDKQFCRLTVKLNERTLPFASELVVRLEGTYCGTLFPSLEAAPGQFSYRTIFDEEGTAMANISRQGGEGLILQLQKVGEFSSTFDLYDIMRMHHYDWTKTSLDDYEITVGLNAAEAGFVIEDWKVVDLGGYNF